MTPSESVSRPTHRRRALRWTLAVCTAAVTAGFAAMAVGLTPEEAFQAENDAAMEKMMAGMEVKPSGDIDRDFQAMMTPHHQGAIDMAIAELRYGKNERMRRIAQEIIVEQQQEIAAMHLALDEPAPSPEPAPTQASPQATQPAASAAHHPSN